jgi:hypothetical protein
MKIADYITIICCLSLSLVLVATCGASLVGLFDDHVDNNELFKMLQPSFNTIVGAFVGTIAGIKMGKENRDNEDKGGK